MLSPACFVSRPNLYLTCRALCGNPAAGAILHSHGGSYMGMIVLAGTAVVAGSLFLLWARCTLSRRPSDRV